MGISSISCSNMVLFDSNGQIKKYENVEQILQEFYDNRLRAYSLRKKALLASMEHTLKKITNQTRFILMIVDEKLKISKRKRMDVVKDLKRHKFDIWLASKDSSNTLRNRAKATDAFEGEDDDEKDQQQQDNNHNNKNAMDVDDGDDDLKKYSIGYKYLLSMSLSSLTMERVRELQKRQGDTLKEVNALKQKTVKDLWRDDLDDLDNYLEEYDNAYEENVKLQRKDADKKRKLMKSKVSGKRKRAKTKKTTKTKVTRGKTTKKESSSTSVSSKESSISKGMKNLFKKNTNSKKKKKLLSTSNALPSDPFSIAKSATKKKSKFVDSEDDDSESPNAGLSLFERARIKRNSPQKSISNSRKRKREHVESENYSDSDSGLEELEPPRKKNKSSSLSTSASTVTLKSISINNAKSKKKKKRSIMDDSDDDFSNESEEYKPPKQARKKVSNYNNESDEDFDIDEEEEDDDDDDDDNESSNFNENRRVLKRKGIKRKCYKEKSASTAYTNEDGESDYNLSEDLEINEVDDSDY